MPVKQLRPDLAADAVPPPLEAFRVLTRTRFDLNW